MHVVICLAFQGKSRWLGSSLVLSATTSSSHPKFTIVFIYIVGRSAEPEVGFIGDSPQSLVDLMKDVKDVIKSKDKQLLQIEEQQKTIEELKAAMNGKYFWSLYKS